MKKALFINIDYKTKSQFIIFGTFINQHHLKWYIYNDNVWSNLLLRYKLSPKSVGYVLLLIFFNITDCNNCTPSNIYKCNNWI